MTWMRSSKVDPMHASFSTAAPLSLCSLLDLRFWLLIDQPRPVPPPLLCPLPRTPGLPERSCSGLTQTCWRDTRVDRTLTRQGRVPPSRGELVRTPEDILVLTLRGFTGVIERSRRHFGWTTMLYRTFEALAYFYGSYSNLLKDLWWFSTGEPATTPSSESEAELSIAGCEKLDHLTGDEKKPDIQDPNAPFYYYNMDTKYMEEELAPKVHREQANTTEKAKDL
ncbi:hypothetical protein Taro_033896 [Colocasia esculenta]|uniref:Uncharacterized protein n=1 Tax=Colocasia esculenta TaxID=4460 RepID=A0A843VWE3_COLES|nr:hypothetical protein [Colocasia esculenta]